MGLTWASPPYRVLQCYIAWPACTESRSRVVQSATQGATIAVSSSLERNPITGAGVVFAFGAACRAPEQEDIIDFSYFGRFEGDFWDPGYQIRC